eukprot:TRINITY_DN2329_c0_g1_i1.p1 TRINITY_DN2329_c0_g1~~TRINITY_DN2329_c0_g1_i1.p1  ORF type:complete len:305 (-),score=40.68 TRINITY_DN2329_c0_g1_i1:1591-2373(-)
MDELSFCTNLPFNSNSNLYSLNYQSQYISNETCGKVEYNSISSNGIGLGDLPLSTFGSIFAVTVAQLVVSGVMFFPIFMSAWSNALSRFCDKWYMRFIFGVECFTIWMLSLIVLILGTRIPPSLGNVYVEFLPVSAKIRIPWYTCDGLSMQSAGQICAGEALSCRKMWQSWEFSSCATTDFYSPTQFSFGLSTLQASVGPMAGWFWQLALLVTASIMLGLYIMYEQVLFLGRIERISLATSPENSILSINNNGVKSIKVA